MPCIRPPVQFVYNLILTVLTTIVTRRRASSMITIVYRWTNCQTNIQKVLFEIKLLNLTTYYDGALSHKNSGENIWNIRR